MEIAGGTTILLVWSDTPAGRCQFGTAALSTPQGRFVCEYLRFQSARV